MKRRFSLLLSRYVLQAVVPYFIFTWLLLSVILFVQQAGRNADLLFSASLSSSLIWQLAIALIPNVIAFTCPVAALVAVIIGLSRMQGDSEMVSIRAAGVGNVQIVLPLILLGIVLSLFAFIINLKGVPIAAQRVREVVLKAALFKLESPIEPGVFNSEINELTIYVKRGNTEKGTWEDIFIRQNDSKNSHLRLITSKEGKIDSKGEDTEIVLADAIVTTFDRKRDDNIATERVEDLRLIVQTKRAELIERLTKAKELPLEMGLSELAEYAETLTGRERTEAFLLWQRRLLLSITPLLFVLMGSGLVTKFNRGGRGFGIFLSLVSLVFYYLFTLLGEQLARTEVISVRMAAVIPLSASIGLTLWLFISQRISIGRTFSSGIPFGKIASRFSSKNKLSKKNSLIDFTTGILDFDLVLSLLKNYIVSISFLITIFIIFTAFEQWRFAGTIENGVFLLLSYLFFLLPFAYIQIAPSALMIATLATYIIKSRQNEIVSWTSAGLSVYRLLVPCFVLMAGIGLLNMSIQEWVLTGANRTQDVLRKQIRSRNTPPNENGVFWTSTNNRFYSFSITGASDNEIKSVKNLTIFQFEPVRFRIESIIAVDKATWRNNRIYFDGRATETVIKERSSKVFDEAGNSILETKNPFKQTIIKPSHLNIAETSNRVDSVESANEKRRYLISLHKKYSTPLLPFIITLFTAPFALSLSRKGTVVTLGYAVAMWLLFMGVTNTIEQYGSSGFISPYLAVWGPLGIFTVLGIYLVTKIRT